MITLQELVAERDHRLAMPIAVFPGISLTGGTVHDVVTKSDVQLAASVAIHERYQTAVVLSAMDLSAEAEAFGCTVVFSPDEIPTVTGSSRSAAKAQEPKQTKNKTGVSL